MPDKPPRTQCAKCPWKTSTDPHEIPRYDQALHRELKGKTIAADPLLSLANPTRLMACHETIDAKSLPCVGWLVHQVGRGNNIGLRLRVLSGEIDMNVKTVGPQHETFEDTLPRGQRPSGAPKAKRPMARRTRP